jgi:hypothetical protein
MLTASISRAVLLLGRKKRRACSTRKKPWRSRRYAPERSIGPSATKSAATPLLHRVIANYDMERYRRLLYRSVMPAIISF